MNFVLASFEQMKTKRDFENLARYGIRRQGVRHVDDQHPGAGASAWAATTSSPPRSGTPAGTRRGCWRRSSMTRPGDAGPDGPLVPRLRQLGHLRHLCFHLFDRTPHAWAKVEQWSRQGTSSRSARRSRCSGQPRAARQGRRPDAPFLGGLPLIERAARDERNFVKKGVSWALRRSAAERGAQRASRDARPAADGISRAAARWIGKEWLKELTSPAVTRQLAGKTRASPGVVGG